MRGAAKPPRGHRRSRTGKGRRGRRVRSHRAHSVWAALALTALSIILPGVGWLFAGRRRIGFTMLGVWAAILLVLGWFAVRQPRELLEAAVDPTSLTLVAVACAVVFLAWAVMLVRTYQLIGPHDSARWPRVTGRVGVAALCVVVALPLAITARYAYIQKDLVNSIFADEASATRPHVSDMSDPWASKGRVNVLLLGGDGGVDREGIRTDSMILASVDTSTGDTTMFSVPRNLMDAPFPKKSPLHDIYPNGFTGPGDAGEWMLNAVYRNVPRLHPGALGTSDNEGADALKLAISGVLGIRVDYYVLVNLAGFEKIVDAIGGVTVNINQPIPIGGNTDRHIPPKSYLQPGPHQHLDGYHALWFARGRYGLDDYNRMERQRCTMKAIIDAADPFTLLRRYKALAEASKKIVRTDIPQDLLPAFVDLALKVKDADVSSVVFVRSDKFNPADPDFGWVHHRVQKALGHGTKTNKPHPDKPKDHPTTEPSPESAGTTEQDPCGYHPVAQG